MDSPKLFLVARVERSVPASSVRDLSRQWTDCLARYRRHRNDEHLEALVEEAVRYAGLHLEHDLATSSYWSKAPLARRVAVLLFLVDRRIVERRSHRGHRLYQPLDHAEEWVSAQPSLAPYAGPTLELVAALRREVVRRTRPTIS
jgi:hypothetical protein